MLHVPLLHPPPPKARSGGGSQSFARYKRFKKFVSFSSKKSLQTMNLFFEMIEYKSTCNDVLGFHGKQRKWYVWLVLVSSDMRVDSHDGWDARLFRCTLDANVSNRATRDDVIFLQFGFPRNDMTKKSAHSLHRLCWSLICVPLIRSASSWRA